MTFKYVVTIEVKGTVKHINKRPIDFNKRKRHYFLNSPIDERLLTIFGVSFLFLLFLNITTMELTRDGLGGKAKKVAEIYSWLFFDTAIAQENHLIDIAGHVLSQQDQQPLANSKLVFHHSSGIDTINADHSGYYQFSRIISITGIPTSPYPINHASSDVQNIGNNTALFQVNNPYGGNAEITIWDMLGRQFKLYRDLHSSDESIKWTYRNERGIALSSGIYAYRLIIRDLSNKPLYISEGLLGTIDNGRINLHSTDLYQRWFDIGEKDGPKAIKKTSHMHSLITIDVEVIHPYTSPNIQSVEIPLDSSATVNIAIQRNPFLQIHQLVNHFTGIPLGNDSVTVLHPTAFVPIGGTRTDGSGSGLLCLPNGTYRLRVHQDGYEDWYSHPIKISPNDTTITGRRVPADTSFWNFFNELTGRSSPHRRAIRMEKLLDFSYNIDPGRTWELPIDTSHFSLIKTALRDSLSQHTASENAYPNGIGDLIHLEKVNRPGEIQPGWFDRGDYFPGEVKIFHDDSTGMYTSSPVTQVFHYKTINGQKVLDGVMIAVASYAPVNMKVWLHEIGKVLVPVPTNYRGPGESIFRGQGSEYVTENDGRTIRLVWANPSDMQNFKNANGDVISHHYSPYKFLQTPQ